MFKLRLAQIGDDAGLILPEEVLVRLAVAEGAEICMSDEPDGIYLTSRNGPLEAQLKSARRIMKRRRKMLRTLGK